MCGAFSILHPFREVGRHFNAGYNDVYEFPRYNARPTQNLPIVIQQEGKNKIVMANWGLTPVWMKGKVLFNTRDESVATKPYFSHKFNSSRCLVPADGFYEWMTVDGKKQPYRFVLKTKQIFGFAGIWEMNKDKKQLEFSIITTSPNKIVSKIHDRMPVIIPKQLEIEYLDVKSNPLNLLHFLKPYPPNLMAVYPVSTLVNSSKNDAPELIEPIT